MDVKTNSALELDEPWTRPWPVDGLESVTHCPVCGESSRSILHSDLIDKAFCVAPGKWTLWKCESCSSAYLDPRPTPDTIHLAYASYYTHQAAVGSEDYDSLSAFRKLRRRLINGYTNWRFSTCEAEASPIGAIMLMALWPYRSRLDRGYRHLPRLPAGGGSLLDVGCGDGAFLNLARTCGWNVAGLDPDPNAAANAKRHGLNVHEGGIEYFEGESELFDVITLNHVIEHVYEPVKVLQACHTLLKPGGQIWLETPNIQSFGHARFQNNWRGLETPRHLVLFNRSSLRQAFINAGFLAPHSVNRPSPCAGMFQASLAIEHSHSSVELVEIPKVTQLWVAITAFAEALFPAHREFLTVTAQKQMKEK